MRRVVLDTNTLISALLFTGISSQLVPLWQSRRLILLVSAPILREYLRTLTYSKFTLTSPEIRHLLEHEVLPFSETVRVAHRLRPLDRDPDDTKFLECAVSGRAEALITGDRDLRDLGSFQGIPIVTPAELLKRLGGTARP